MGQRSVTRVSPQQWEAARVHAEEQSQRMDAYGRAIGQLGRAFRNLAIAVILDTAATIALALHAAGII